MLHGASAPRLRRADWLAGSGGIMSHFSTVESTRASRSVCVVNTKERLLMEPPEGGDINRQAIFLNTDAVSATKTKFQLFCCVLRVVMLENGDTGQQEVWPGPGGAPFPNGHG